MSAGPIDRASWVFPSAPKRVNKPSWMGIPATSLAPPIPSVPAPALLPVEERVPSSRPRPATLPPPSSRAFAAAAAAALGSVLPPAISTMREVELESEVVQLKARIAELAAHLASARDRVLADSEQELVRLAVTVATRIVGREVETDPYVILPWIREGIAMLPGEEIVVAVAPDVAEHLGCEELASELPKAKRVIVDGSLRPGAVEVREGNGIVEVGAEARVAAMSDALGLDGAK